MGLPMENLVISRTVGGKVLEQVAQSLFGEAKLWPFDMMVAQIQISC